MIKEQPSLALDADIASGKGPVKCLGMTFESDEARRAYFLEKLRDKLKEPEFRKIEGFPIGADEDILALSDPPYYTACPNPFVEEFIKHYGKPYDPGTDHYRREPFAVDVSEGKTDPIYTAHSYHTKVPHKAIMQAILHYTDPGDIVLDGFAGTGMTGVAAQMCADPEPDFRRSLEAEWAARGHTPPTWGARRAVLNDLGPAASFIAANYNLPFDVEAFSATAGRMLDELEQELGWMYDTHGSAGQIGRINYTVWSEVFSCPECAREVVFLDESLDPETQRVRNEFPCPHCRAALSKDNLQRVFESRIDPSGGGTWRHIKLRPAQIQYCIGGRRYERHPDDRDRQTLARIQDLPLLEQVPTNHFPIDRMYHGSRLAPKGFTRVHHLFLPRPAQALGTLWAKVNTEKDTRLRHMLMFLAEQGVRNLSVLNAYEPLAYSQNARGQKTVYYVPSQHAEVSPWFLFDGKLRRLLRAFERPFWHENHFVQGTGDCARLPLPGNSVDYIFTDPPFGENIYYADLNFLVESWHRVWTNTEHEAIVDQAKSKALPDYQRLMQRCFELYYEVLKPGRWMTVVFHNSRNSVWNAIQESMLAAGFVVADVRTLDKQQGSYRQVTSTAVKQDLIISAYKPNGGLEARFELEAGTEEGVWDFIRTHLRQLPVFVSRNGQAEVIAERQCYLLFDRMVAFHVQRGVTVPLSASEFHAGLQQRFPEREGMYFLPEQVAEYDKKRMTVREVLQLQLIVSDEASAIQWLKQQLTKKPQTFQEIHPQFMRELGGWQKHERPLELSELLEQSFLHYDGMGDVASQIHSYLSTNFKELRNLAKDDPGLVAKAKGRWYVPDPNKAGDLEKLRERALLREFAGYRESRQRRLKVFRLEAVRAGFKKAWGDRVYQTIIDVARKIPDQVLQEDPKLLMWYDQALTRTGERDG